MKKKMVIAVLICAVISSSVTNVFAEGGLFSVTIPSTEECAVSDTYSPFAFSLFPDLLLAGTGSALTGVTFYQSINNSFPEWNGVLYDQNDVNVFDRWAMCPYNKSWDIAGTVACGMNLAMPVALFATEAVCGNFPASEFVTLGGMYAESFLLSYGIKGLLKMTALRVRPYMYFDGYPEDAVVSKDFEFSWPSGHTTNAFMAAVFTTCVFSWYYPDSVFRIPVTCTALGIACATGAMRMLSGNHFLTDVLTGALIGSFCGFIVPFVHHVVAEQRGNSAGSPSKNVSLSVMPYMISLKIQF